MKFKRSDTVETELLSERFEVPIYDEANEQVGVAYGGNTIEAIKVADLFAASPDFHSFVSTIARLVRDGENGFEPDETDSLHTLDDLIVKARALGGNQS